jgi:hypothetical protein
MILRTLRSPQRHVQKAAARVLSIIAPHDLLGVRLGASDREIKDAYRKLALECHPDRNAGDETASAKFQQLFAAYSQCSGKQQRVGGYRGASFSEADAEARRQFEELFGNQGDILREMERQRAGGGFADSGFGAISTSIRREMVRAADGRVLLRTTRTTVSPDGSHAVETEEGEVPVGAGHPGGLDTACVAPADGSGHYENRCLSGGGLGPGGFSGGALRDAQRGRPSPERGLTVRHKSRTRTRDGQPQRNVRRLTTEESVK